MHRLLKINKLVGTLWRSYMADELCMVKHVYWTVQIKTPFRFKAFKLLITGNRGGILFSVCKKVSNQIIVLYD